MKKPTRNTYRKMKKVSNPEIPVELLVALGAITVFGVGFAVWRATRNVASIPQLLARAQEEGGDYAEAANRAQGAIQGSVPGAANQALGAGQRFVNDFNMGGGQTPSAATPESTQTPVVNTTTVPTPPVSIPTPAPAASAPTSAPVVPSNLITDEQTSAILAVAPNVGSLRAARNEYERRPTTDVRGMQSILIRAFNRDKGLNINAEAFADGNIGRMTRALIYWARNHPRYTDRQGMGNADTLNPNNMVFLYDGIGPKLVSLLRDIESRTTTQGQIDERRRREQAAATGGTAVTEAELWRGSGQSNAEFGQSTNQPSDWESTGSGSTNQSTNWETINPPAPAWGLGSGIKVKSKKRKL